MHIVIIGNSAAGLSALEAFRRRDRSSPVTVVSAEAGRPYSRVLLPYYLRGRIPHEGLFIRPEDYYERLDARTVFGEVVERVDAEEHEVVLRDGRAIAYDRLLVAAGSRPAAPPIEGLEGPGVQGFWTLDDAARLDRDLRPGVRLMVLGAGFVALQAAWAAHRRGAAVTVVELEGRILPRVLDEEAARLLRGRIEAAGVQIATSVCIAGVERACGELCCTAAGADTYEADIVIVATGVVPNDGLLAEAVSARGPGLEVAATMETAVADVFAAGDVARAPMWGGAAGVLALWPVAVAQGRVAGANLAGAGLELRGRSQRQRHRDVRGDGGIGGSLRTGAGRGRRHPARSARGRLPQAHPRRGRPQRRRLPRRPAGGPVARPAGSVHPLRPAARRPARLLRGTAPRGDGERDSMARPDRGP